MSHFQLACFVDEMAAGLFPIDQLIDESFQLKHLTILTVELERSSA